MKTCKDCKNFVKVESPRGYGICKLTKLEETEEFTKDTCQECPNFKQKKEKV
jgi:hypothetical protein